MQLYSTNYLSFLPLVSRIGHDARVLPITSLDFSLDSAYQVDLTATMSSAQLAHPIQAMFVDNSRVPYGATVVQVFGTGQRIVVPAQAQGYYPLLLTSNSFVFTITNGSNLGLGVSALVDLFFMNVPFVSGQWSTASDLTGGYGVGPLGGNPLGQ